MSFTVYTAKYFETQGVLEVTVEETHIDGMVRMISIEGKLGSYPGYLHSREWHLSREDAVLDARLKAGAKLNALHKKIKKLEKLLLEDLK